MPVLTLSDEQVVALIEQLPESQQQRILHHLLRIHWADLGELSAIGQPGAQQAARERGRDWDAMSNEERDRFIDDVLHEDR